MQRQESNPSALGPFIGFIILIVVGGGSFLVSPQIINWMETTSVNFGALGWPLLPIIMPDDWPFIVQRLVVTAFFFMLGFVVLMIALLGFMTSGQEADPTAVSLDEIRKEKERKKKERLKRARRR